MYTDFYVYHTNSATNSTIYLRFPFQYLNAILKICQTDQQLRPVFFSHHAYIFIFVDSIYKIFHRALEIMERLKNWNSWIRLHLSVIGRFKKLQDQLCRIHLHIFHLHISGEFPVLEYAIQ